MLWRCRDLDNAATTHRSRFSSSEFSSSRVTFVTLVITTQSSITNEESKNDDDIIVVQSRVRYINVEFEEQVDSEQLRSSSVARRTWFIFDRLFRESIDSTSNVNECIVCYEFFDDVHFRQRSYVKNRNRDAQKKPSICRTKIKSSIFKTEAIIEHIIHRIRFRFQIFFISSQRSISIQIQSILTHLTLYYKSQRFSPQQQQKIFFSFIYNISTIVNQRASSSIFFSQTRTSHFSSLSFSFRFSKKITIWTSSLHHEIFQCSFAMRCEIFRETRRIRRKRISTKKWNILIEKHQKRSSVLWSNSNDVQNRIECQDRTLILMFFHLEIFDSTFVTTSSRKSDLMTTKKQQSFEIYIFEKKRFIDDKKARLTWDSRWCNERQSTTILL